MAMFYCDQFMVDTDCIAAAGMFDGTGALDGQYLLALILVVGHNEMVNFGAIFSTQAEREQVFQALSAHKKVADHLRWEAETPERD
jgi:hypothetical protein